MTRTGNCLGRLVRDESGQDIVEYALVALGAMASMRNLASSVGTVFARVGTTLAGAV